MNFHPFFVCARHAGRRISCCIRKPTRPRMPDSVWSLRNALHRVPSRATPSSAWPGKFFVIPVCNLTIASCASPPRSTRNCSLPPAHRSKPFYARNCWNCFCRNNSPKAHNVFACEILVIALGAWLSALHQPFAWAEMPFLPHLLGLRDRCHSRIWRRTGQLDGGQASVQMPSLASGRV